MGRVACCDQVGLKKGPWTPDEDAKLVAYIQRRGHGSWRALPKRAGMSSKIFSHQWICTSKYSAVQGFSSCGDRCPGRVWANSIGWMPNVVSHVDISWVVPWDSTEGTVCSMDSSKVIGDLSKVLNFELDFLNLNWLLWNWRSDVLVCRWRSWCDKHVRIHLDLVLQSEIDRVCLFKARFEWEHDHWGWPNSQHSRELVGLKSSWYMLAFSASRALRSISFHSPNEHCWSMLWFLFLPFFLFLDGSEMCGHVLVMLKVHSSHGFNQITKVFPRN